jgi:hypothetical protein
MLVGRCLFPVVAHFIIEIFKHGLTEIENRMLRKICGPKEGESNRKLEKVRSYMICTERQILLG